MKRVLLVLGVVSLAGCHASSNSDAPIHYPCTPDAGGDQCAGGFVCWHDGICRDPNAEETRLCANEAECAGWHCGPSDGGFGTCYDRETAGEISCRAALEVDGGQGDCAKGWRCGLENYCVDPSVPQSRACVDDSYCAPGWRCGEAQPRRCLDTTAEALPSDVPPVLSPTIQSPLFAMTPGSGVFASAEGSWAYDMRDGGVPYRLGNGIISTMLKVSAPVTGLGTTQTTVLVLTTQELVKADPNGPKNSPHQFSSADGTPRMRIAKKTVLIFNDRQLKMTIPDRTADLSVDLFAGLPGGATRTVYDVEILSLPVVGGNPAGDIVWVASSTGLYAAARMPDGKWVDRNNNISDTTPTWYAVLLPNVPNTVCVNGTGTAVPRQLVATDGSLLVRLQDGSGPPSVVRVTTRPSSYILVPTECQPSQPELDFSTAFDVCPPNTTLDWLKATAGGGESQCIGANGGVVRSQLSPGKLSQISTDRIEIDRSTGQTFGYLDSSGRPFNCLGSTNDCKALLFPGGAVSVFGNADGGLEVKDTAGGFSRKELGDGLVRIDKPSSTPMGPLGNAGTLELERFGYSGALGVINLADGKPVAVLENSVDVGQLSADDDRLPVSSTTSVNARGEQVLTIAAGDRIWSGATASFNAVAPPKFAVKLVPLPFGKIGSLTSVEVGADGGVLQAGYALVQERVFSYRADTDVRWRADELTLPADATRPIAVWSQGP
ncbi:MAG: hypothetical protein ACJ790_06335, partial [Myxococcaceae bacterium]